MDEYLGMLGGFTGLQVINLSWVSCFVTFATTAIIYYLTPGHYDEKRPIFGIDQIPTISHTGSVEPEESIFAAGLHIFSIISYALFIFIYRVSDKKIKQETENNADEDIMVYMNGINQFLFTTGSIFSVFMFLTGSVSLTLSLPLHGLAAFIMFATGYVHVIVFTLTIGKNYELTSINLISNNNGRNQGRTKMLHNIALFLLVVINGLLLLSAIIVFFSCGSFQENENKDEEKNTKTCSEYSLQTVVVMEYITVIGLLLYVEGFRCQEFSDACIGFSHVANESNSNSNSNNGSVNNEGENETLSSPHEIEYLEIEVHDNLT